MEANLPALETIASREIRLRSLGTVVRLRAARGRSARSRAAMALWRQNAARLPAGGQPILSHQSAETGGPESAPLWKLACHGPGARPRTAAARKIEAAASSTRR